MVPHDVSWPDVVALLILSIPGILAAYYAHRNTKELRTGNDKTVGEMVTDSHAKLSDEATPFATHGPPPPTTGE